MTRWMESQVETRARLDAEISERAYAELAASVSGPWAAPRVVVGDLEQVDAAARACLAHLGQEPGAVPDEVTDRDERLEWLCRPTGTMRRVVRLDEGWQTRAFGTMLGTLDSGEAVALIPRGVRGYTLLEPSSGSRKAVTREVAAHIEPQAVLFYRPLPARPLGIRDLVTFVARVFDNGDYLVVFLAALAATLVGLAPAWANYVAFGVVAPSGQMGLILPIASLLLGVAVSSALIGACRNLVMARVSTKIDVAIEAATFARVLALPSAFFKQYSSGDLGSRVANMKSLTQQIVSILLGSALTAFLSLAYVGQVVAYAPALALPALAVMVMQAALTALVTLATVRFERATLDADAKLSGTVTALLGGIQKIKLAGAEDRAFAKWAHGYATYARAAYNRPVTLVALPALVSTIGILGGIGIFYLAGRAGLSVADYMAFNAAYGQVTAAVMALAGIAGQVARIRPMLEMVAPILETAPETAEDKPSVETLSGSIDVSGVSFRYNDSSPYVLRDLSFRIRPGEYVALVGKSGCGKSTILRLLLGFETPERGTIFYGPHDVAKTNLQSLRSHIGTVMQDGKLFMGDLSSNITISTPSATIDDAWEAAEIAGIADDIRKMPMGMQTLVTEGGGGVSGGQRQRIMIARAVCGHRRILMFDEATSALDNKTQKHVSNALDGLRCTRVVVAHRLSTVRHCDRILVVDDGHIAEEGTYEELLERGGLFAELVARQRLDQEA